MIGLAAALDDYLTMRRALGYQLIRPEKLLRQFIDYLDGRGVTTITTDDALAWATLPDHGDPSWLAYRLSAIRGFARYLHTIDPDTQAPPTDALPWAKRRATPYLYSQHDIAALVSAANGLRSPLRVATYQTLIPVLFVTGLRVSEAINLDNADLDLTGNVLLVREGKFGKTRELPLHPSTTAALRTYLHRRDRLRPNRPTIPAVFISPPGSRLLYNNVQATFAGLTRHAGLLPRSRTCRPRIHDLRHSFAVHTLQDAYSNGGDVGFRLTLLSTYLGHVDPAGTYWYLSAAPELMAQAAQRLEHHQEGQR